MASCYEQLRAILNMQVDSANLTEGSISHQSEPLEELSQDINEPQQVSDGVNDPDKVISEQTLSLDTLSELNAMGDN